MRKAIFISSEILNWDASTSTSSIGEVNDVTRPYEMIGHSQNLINEKASEFNLSDAISNLKRALNHRLQIIESLYKLKSIKFKGMPKGYLELLEVYGLARPYIIKKLMEIRNKIEHKDAKPPRKERCKELIDVTWYFLKSTDRLIYFIPSSISLSPNQSHKLSDKYGCEMDLNHTSKKISVSGWFPINYILNKQVDDSIKIICSTMHDGSYWKGKNMVDDYHKDKTKEDIWLIGNFILDENEKQLFFKKAFESY